MVTSSLPGLQEAKALQGVVHRCDHPRCYMAGQLQSFQDFGHPGRELLAPMRGDTFHSSLVCMVIGVKKVSDGSLLQSQSFLLVFGQSTARE